MKIAVFGVWHVHAPDYTKKAQEYGEVIGFYEKDDTLAEAFSKKFGLYRFSTPEELLESDAEGVIVCSASSDHAEDIIKIDRPILMLHFLQTPIVSVEQTDALYDLIKDTNKDCTYHKIDALSGDFQGESLQRLLSWINKYD